ncbi:NusG domain II-containing protein [Pseudothermotoga sp.]
MNKRSDLFKKYDVLLVILLVTIFLAFYWTRPREGQSIEVFVDGKLSMQIKTPGSYEVRDGDKYLMRVIFDGRKVHVEDSNCPLKICERTGSVGPGGTIICVPNRVLVKFKTTADTEVDVMTW